MTPQFTTTRRVEFCDTDMAGIAHFSSFYKWMEQTEHEYFRSLDLKINNPQPDGSVIGWPRVSAKCRFEAPAYYEDIIEIRLRVARKGIKSLNYELEFWRDETRLAQGEMKTACCLCRPGEALQSIAIPDEYTRRIIEAD